MSHACIEIKNSRAEDHARRNPNKEVKVITNVLHPNSVNGFITGSRITFEPKHARGVNMTVHFQFNGKQTAKATIIIANETIDVKEGNVGTADLTIIADSEIWIKMVNKDTSSIDNMKAITSGKVKIQGNLKLFKQFQGCFVGQ